MNKSNKIITPLHIFAIRLRALVLALGVFGILIYALHSVEHRKQAAG